MWSTMPTSSCSIWLTHSGEWFSIFLCPAGRFKKANWSNGVTEATWSCWTCGPDFVRALEHRWALMDLHPLVMFVSESVLWPVGDVIECNRIWREDLRARELASQIIWESIKILLIIVKRRFWKPSRICWTEIARIPSLLWQGFDTVAK